MTNGTILWNIIYMMDMKNSKRNCTTLFLLPLSGTDKNVWIENGCNNAYIKIDDIKMLISNGVPHYHSDIELVFGTFQKGHYSKFPNYIKQKILAFWGITSKEERLYQILYPEQYFYETGLGLSRVRDIHPKPDMDIEIYNPNDNKLQNNEDCEQITVTTQSYIL